MAKAVNTPQTPEQILNDLDYFFSLDESVQDYFLSNYADQKQVIEIKAEKQKRKLETQEIDFKSFEALKDNFKKLRKFNITFVLDDDAKHLPLYLRKPKVAEVLGLNKILQLIESEEFWKNPDNINSLKATFSNLFFANADGEPLSADTLEVIINDYNLVLQLIAAITTNGLLFKKN